jgi:DNA-directed RNA polymerase specialized sigma24 family protein
MANIEPQGGATMRPDDLRGVSEEDSDPDIEEILVRFDPYIVAEAEKLVRRSSNFAHPEVLDLEIAEVAQRVRIKLWGVLKREKHIEFPKAYILKIVNNEFHDILRRRKPLLPLPTDEDGEIYMGNVILTESEGMSDPAYEFEQKEGLNNWMALAAQVVSKLSQRQKHAMICLLKERIDNYMQLVEAFEQHQIDIEAFEWPDDEVDETRLKASLSAARRNIAEWLGILLSEYKKRGIPDFAPCFKFR